MDTNRPELKEAVVVEGRDDEAAVLRAVDALVIPTHGYGIRKETLDLIAKAYENQGIIIFTDPDHAGEAIRKKLLSLFPEAKQAFLSRSEAERNGDIGIENAAPSSIADALKRAGMQEARHDCDISMDDLTALGLAGGDGSFAKRECIGAALGIGSGNAKSFLKKLKMFGIKRSELDALCGGKPGSSEMSWQRTEK